MNSTLMYHTILERALNYLSVGIKIFHVHREYLANFLLFRWRFYELQRIFGHFSKYFLKVTVTLFFFETAIGNILINTNTLKLVLLWCFKHISLNFLQLQHVRIEVLQLRARKPLIAAVLLYHFENNTEWPLYYFFILSDTWILHLYTGSRLVLTIFYSTHR